MLQEEKKKEVHFYIGLTHSRGIRVTVIYVTTSSVSGKVPTDNIHVAFQSPRDFPAVASAFGFNQPEASSPAHECVNGNKNNNKL